MSKGTDGFAKMMTPKLKPRGGKGASANGTHGLGKDLGMGGGGTDPRKLQPGMRPKTSTLVPSKPLPAPFTVGFTDMAQLDRQQKPSRFLGFNNKRGGTPGSQRMVGPKDSQPDEL